MHILFCDDDGDKGLNSTAADNLRGAKHVVHWFDGLNAKRAQISFDAAVIAAEVRKELRRHDCEGLLMDLKWWIPTLGENNQFGLDVLEHLVAGGFPNSLSLDRIVVFTRYSGDPGVLRRVTALNIPNGNVASKTTFDKEKRKQFLAIFK
jgi:hypothetical protein